MSARGERMVAALSAALEAERGLLLAGDFDRLAEAAATREARTEAFAALSPEDLAGSAAPLARLRAQAARNVALLQAALDGAAAGRRRVTEIAEARRTLTGYDRSGAPVDRTATATSGRRA